MVACHIQWVKSSLSLVDGSTYVVMPSLSSSLVSIPDPLMSPPRVSSSSSAFLSAYLNYHIYLDLKFHSR
jgi:hypothetical protein